MKKAKMLLSAIAVLAVVGGALAFKANTKFANQYCTTNIDPQSGGFCSILRQNVTTTTDNSFPQLWYTVKPAAGCQSDGPCQPSTFLKAD